MNRQRAEDMLVATSRAMQETVAAARQIAQGREPVLVDGETGAGRRLLARFLHEQSPRDRQPVVYVRCDTLTVDATDRILFGDPACGAAGILEQLGDGTL
ncbi:sigma 54-interacting transcriptional regulator, partial [bacterium]|nr:sigma 54-interacting transcriptional regulator [bacterium]MBU1983377.1 sigma 54-interacting transcriptional regulator [bacterium]